MMEAARTSETLVNFYQITWRYNPEDSQPSSHTIMPGNTADQTGSNNPTERIKIIKH
jgi:hypothetical protein